MAVWDSLISRPYLDTSKLVPIPHLSTITRHSFQHARDVSIPGKLDELDFRTVYPLTVLVSSPTHRCFTTSACEADTGWRPALGSALTSKVSTPR